MNALLAIYHSNVEMSTARGRDGVAPTAIRPTATHLARGLSRSMRSGGHKFTSYRQKLLSKGAGKYPRVVAIATARDRIVLKSLSHFLADVFPESVPRTAQEKIDLLKTELQLLKYDGYVRVDIVDFYGSINHAVLESALNRGFRKAQPLQLIKSAITTPTSPDGRPRNPISPLKGVPQGLAISNALAEISLGAFDRQYVNRTDLFYLRYVDDVIVLCAQVDCAAVFQDLETQLARLGLEVHALSKTNSKSSLGATTSRFDYLGYEFEDGKVSVRTESVSKVESAVVRVLTRYRHQAAQPGMSSGAQAQFLAECVWKLNLVITGCTYRSAKRGWVAYFSQITDLSVLKRLDAMVHRNLTRFSLEQKINPKRFVTSFWRIRHPQGAAYIPNFDRYSNDQKRALLADTLDVPGARTFTPTQVEQAFASRVGKLVKDLDRHIGDVS